MTEEQQHKTYRAIRESFENHTKRLTQKEMGDYIESQGLTIQEYSRRWWLGNYKWAVKHCRYADYMTLQQFIDTEDRMNDTDGRWEHINITVNSYLPAY